MIVFDGEWLDAQIKEDFDVVYTKEMWSNYVEVKGEYCGDMRCYRYYSNKVVTER